jgi:hypothetical protein
MIDKIILQCSRKKIDDNYFNNIKSYFNDEFVYYNFIESDCIEYFQNNPLIGFENIIEKFNSFKNGAHKMDLFRYYFLFINGGVFIDDDVLIYHNLNQILSNYDLLLVNSNSHPYSICNGMLGCSKNNSIIYKALVDAYNIDNMLLFKDYFLICKNLYSIYNNSPFLYKTKILNEKRIEYSPINGYDIIYDNTFIYFRHFWSKKINYNINFQLELNNLLFIKKIFIKFYFFVVKVLKYIKRKNINLFSFLLNNFYVFKLYNYKNATILNGPFKGMKYIKTSTFGPILPKLIGSYEEPIHLWIEEVLNNEYDTIINIGSGEGYYASGFAKYSPNSNVFAYDIDKRGILLLNKIKYLNNLNNLSTSSEISYNLINNIIYKKSLIFIDVEGYEYFYLNINNISNLTKSDIIVEIHNFIIPNLEEILSKRFQNTHHIRIIKDPNTRLSSYYNLNNFSNEQKEFLIDEKRYKNMSWMFLSTKK